MDNKHYKQFDEVLGQDTTDSDRPSAKNTTVKFVAETLQVPFLSFISHVLQNIYLQKLSLKSKNVI